MTLGFSAPTPGSVFAGEYRVISRLGEGGMGAVYVAEQMSTGQKRALKLMLPELAEDATSRARFEQEARVGSRIESEHIVSVVDAGVDRETGFPWLAMELLQGEDLAALMNRAGPLPARAVRNVIEQLCHAVGAAHAAGVVHRDLKPENVFVAHSRRAGVDYTVKVLDFGIAKVIADTKTTKTGTLGSPMWMAPEQTGTGAPIGPEADVWAIALLTFHLLTKRLFWRAAENELASMTALLREIVLDPLCSASERARECFVQDRLPSGFDAWFARSVNREPRARFSNAKEQWNALRPLLASDISSRPPSQPDFARTEIAPRVDRTISQAPLERTRAASDPDVPTRRTGMLIALALLALGAVGLVTYRLSLRPSDPPVVTSVDPMPPAIAISSDDPPTIPVDPLPASAAPLPVLEKPDPNHPHPTGAGLEPSVVQSVVRKNLGPVRKNCAPTSGPPRTVTVRVALTIAPSGNVQDANATGDDPAVASCVARETKKWTFPPSATETTVNIPFQFVVQ